LPFGFGAQQIRQPLGLGKVEAPVEQGATGELAWTSLAQSSNGRQFCEQARHNRATTVKMKFDERLPSGRVRSREAQQQCFIDQGAVSGLQAAQRSPTRLWKPPA
jgi:hypothetical protein